MNENASLKNELNSKSCEIIDLKDSFEISSNVQISKEQLMHEKRLLQEYAKISSTNSNALKGEIISKKQNEQNIIKNYNEKINGINIKLKEAEKQLYHSESKLNCQTQKNQGLIKRIKFRKPNIKR